MTADVDGAVTMGNPNVQDPFTETARPQAVRSPAAGEVFLGNVDPPYDASQPEPGASVIGTDHRREGLNTPARRELRGQSTPTSSVRVQEFYSAESTETGDGRDQGGVRWMARFTEFLRTTATRGAHGMDRVLDNLGLTSPHAAQQDIRLTRTMTTPVRFSPPEELPPPVGQRGPPMPMSWAQAGSTTPLFGPSQVAQLRQAYQDHPQLYGPPPVSEDSDRSSRLQAEVQRQLEDYTQRYQSQMNELLREVEVLRAEREEWRSQTTNERIRREPQSLHGDSTVPQGNSLNLPHGSLPSVYEGPTEPQGNLQPVRGVLPVSHREPQPLSQGALRQLSQDRPQEVPEETKEHPREPQSLPGDSTVPRGNSHLPHGRSFYDHARGQKSGPFEDHARGQESGPQASKNNLEDVPKASAPAQGLTSSSTTPQQWLGAPAQQDAMTLIAGGVAQLQAAMLKQMSSDKNGEKTPETVKPGTSTLPSLPQVKSETASVDLLDWLELIEAPMSDLSDGSASWWKQVRTTSSAAYDKWVVAGPMERLGVVPVSVEELEEGRWSRVNSRAASMILSALDESIRSELVSRRMTGSVVSIIFRLLTLYQPGGEEEKYRTLQQLQNPPKETEPGKAVESLRSWSRWLRRCRELNLQIPDPSLLVRGLNAIVKGVMEKSNEANFRTNLVRSTLMIDSNPTSESVEKYYKHLMGECESLATAIPTNVSTSTPTPKAEPRLRPVKPDTRTPPTTSIPPIPPRSSSQTTPGTEEEKDRRATTACKFFGRTFKGCARAGRCPYLHSWEGIEKEKSSRCLACGGKHMAKECPNKKVQGGSPGGAANSEPKAPPTIPKASPPSSSKPPANKTVRIEETQETAQGSSGTGPNQGDGASVDLQEVLSDVGKIPKAMSASSIKKFTLDGGEQPSSPMGMEPMAVLPDGAEETPKMAAMELKEYEEASTGLLDSGASHPMRPASPREYLEGDPVRVTLAGEDVRVLRQNGQGTILVQEEDTSIQPIVPLGAVIENLGYTLHWSPRNLRLTHPSKKSIKAKIKNHCPEVAACDALHLIEELEMSHVNVLNTHVESLRARLEVMQKEEKRDWAELMKEFSQAGSRATLLRVLLLCPFTKGLPPDVHNLMLQGFDLQGGEKYLKALPITRRKRRALLRSRSWVINLNSNGASDKKDPF